MKKIILSLIILLGTISISTNVRADEKETNNISCSNKITVHLFWGNGCPHCEKAIKYLEGTIADEYKECFALEKHEVWYDEEGSQLMQDVAAYFGEDVSGVPYIVIGEDTFGGYSSSLNKKIEKAIVSNANSDEYVDVIEKVKNGETNKIKKSNSGDTIVTIAIILVAIGGIYALIKTSRSN